MGSRCFYDHTLQGLGLDCSHSTRQTTDTAKIQGTKVHESREIRTKMRVLRKVTPATSAFAEIIKYDGSQAAPKWMDVDRSTALDFAVQFLNLGLIVQKTGLKPSATWLLTYLQHRIRQKLGLLEQCATIGSTSWCCWWASQT